MAQSGYTPLSLYYSATASTAPLAANLVAGELALNTNDGKLYYKDSSGVVQVLASKTGNVNVSSFSGGTTGLTPSTATTGVVTLAGTLAQVNGGTGFSTYTTGDTVYASASNTLSKLAIGSTGQILRVVGGVPAWGTDYVGTVTSVSGTGTVNGLTLTGTVTSSGSLTLGGTLDLSSPPAIGGTTPSTGKFTSLTDTGLTSGRVTYATTGGLLTDSANMTFSGTALTLANDASISGLTVGKGGGAVSNNTAVGNNALGSNTSGSSNSALGFYALGSNTTGYQSVAIGQQALNTNSTGIALVSVGFQALYSNTTASNNTAVGYQALYSNTLQSNTAVGTSAGYTNTTGSITAFGSQVLYANTTGSLNCGFGGFDGAFGVGAALRYNTTGQSNHAFGYGTLTTNTTGNNNAGFGYNALNSNTTGSQNVAVGIQALQANTTASLNTAVGYLALTSNTTGQVNTALGAQTGQAITTGAYNICIGFQAGYVLNSITTGSRNYLIGDYSYTSGATATDQIVIGYNTSGKGNSTGIINAGGGGIYQGNNSATWSITSDARLKKNIVDNTIGLSAISQIQVRNFEYRTKDEITDLPSQNAINILGVQLGAIAQELKEILPDCVKTESTGVMSVDTTNLTWYLINAVKELNAKITAMENK
jgi:hypothetical protein